MQCEEVREQFADYVNDRIAEPARSLVAKHLMVCENCRSEANDLKALWITLGDIPSAEPGPQLQSRFHVMLEAYEHGRANASSKSWWNAMNVWLGSWWPKQPALQLAICLAVLIISVVIGRQGLRSSGPIVQPNSEVTQLRDELAQMRQTVALSLMQQESASDRLKGVNWSYQLQNPGSEVLRALLDTLMHDTNVNVRLATVDALRQFGERPVVRRGVVEAMAREESPMVQVALIDLAVDLREKESIVTLRELTQDEKLNDAVRDRAQRGLMELE